MNNFTFDKARRHQQRDSMKQTKILNGNENLPRKLNHQISESQGDNCCFVRMNYRSSISIEQIDELKILRENQIVYKGCLQDGDSFTFKSNRDSNQSAYKLEIYRNDSFDDEMISCCEYGLMHDNQGHSFQVKEIIGCKPCPKCPSKHDAFPLSIVQSLSKVSEKKCNQQSAEMEKLVPSESNSLEIHSSENNPDLSQFKSPEEEKILFNSLDGNSSPKKSNGPPQLSPMLSFNDHSLLSTSSEMTEQNFNVLSHQDLNTPSVPLSNDIFESLSNLLCNLFFRSPENTQTSSNRFRREKGNVEWFNLIYLHSFSPDPSIIQKIRRWINIVKIFDDTDDCIAYINALSNQKIILILSNDFCDSFLPRIENALHIFSIYVFSENSNENFTSSSSIPIRGVYRSIDEISQMISDDINLIKLDLLSFQPVYGNRTALDTTFVFFQLLNDILRDRHETETAFEELVDFARREYEGNEYELAQIGEFERTYKNTQAILWLSRQCFLSKMLHRAMFLHEVDILFKLRLFIQDLNVQIEKEAIIESVSVYLGNTIDSSELNSLEALRDNRNLVMFPQFLFASMDQFQAIARAKKSPHRSEELLNLLIRIDFPSATKCLTRLSLNDDGMNILINAGLITKIIGIEKDYQEKGSILIHFQFVSYADEINLHEGIQRARSEIESSSPLFRSARLLLKANYQSFAEHFFSNLVNEDLLINDTKRQTSLSQGLELLALLHFQRENFQRASELFLLCLKAYLRYVPRTSSTLYLTYRDLAESVYRVGEYQLALDYFQQAFDTQLHSNNPSLFDSAFCSFRLSLVYFKQGNDQNAIQALHRAEKLLQQSGETHHKQLINVYETLADNYYYQAKYDDAVIYYKKIIEVQQSIEPNNPKELYSMHFVIASIYLKKGNYHNAMIYYERSFDYAKECLPEKHYTFVLLHNNIGYTYYEEKQYSTALDHYSQGLSLASECLSDDNTLIGTLRSNAALVYSTIGRFDEAIESMEKAIEQLRKTLSDDDDEVAYKRTLLDGIKRKKILHEVIDETFQYF